MPFRVNPSSTEPVYAQIVRQVREGLARGALRPGDRLPTVRELALNLLVNPNTIAAAYREMERQGLVHTQRGRGTFAAEMTPAASVERRRLLQKHAEVFWTEAAHLGATEEEGLDVLRVAAKAYRLKEHSNE